MNKQLRSRIEYIAEGSESKREEEKTLQYKYTREDDGKRMWRKNGGKGHWIA